MTALVCHPLTPCDAVRNIDANVERTRAGLSVAYRIEGDLQRIRIPAPRAPARAQRLWQHTCCEIFVARNGAPAYQEFNFSPSGEWAGYAFRRYREGGPSEAPDPRIAVRASAALLELDASIQTGAGALRLGLSAVIEERGGGLSYWALRHPPGKPDFHHAEAFALELD